MEFIYYPSESSVQGQTFASSAAGFGHTDNNEQQISVPLNHLFVLMYYPVIRNHTETQNEIGTQMSSHEVLQKLDPEIKASRRQMETPDRKHTRGRKGARAGIWYPTSSHRGGHSVSR